MHARHEEKEEEDSLLVAVGSERTGEHHGISRGVTVLSIMGRAARQTTPRGPADGRQAGRQAGRRGS